MHVVLVTFVNYYQVLKLKLALMRRVVTVIIEYLYTQAYNYF